VTVVGYIHGLPDGRITDDSVIVIEGATYPIPERGQTRAAPHRIWAALKAAGYEPANYRVEYGAVEPNGVREIRLVNR
jgi:hypothetical protein